MAERIPLNSLQRAIYTVLAADATLAGLNATVTDWMLEEQAYPAVVVGEYVQDSQNTKTRAVCEVTMSIHCYSTVKGYKEVNQMMDAVVAALTTATPLELTSGFSSTNGRLVTAWADREINPKGDVVSHAIVQIGFGIAVD